jgi:hypothetical protein
MSDLFQRLFTISESPVHSLNAQAALGRVRPPQRSQFSLLVRHFLERFFNHESFSPDGDAKARLVLLAFAAALPPFTVALYLWPIYHPFIGDSQHPLLLQPPPYWLQVNHHFFFVVYSFVVMGIVTVFQWDLFFPDLLDVFILSTLPVLDRKLFLARVAAITILLAGFLFDANLFVTLMLPISIEPRSMSRFFAGHLLALGAGGLFSAAFILALQGVLLSLLGARLFRRISLFLQGLSITVLLMLFLLFPVLSDAVPVFLQHRSAWALWFPPFWFLGIYQRLLEGTSALPVYSELAHTGYVATLVAVAISLLAYPFAYLRRVRQLMEGSGTRDTRNQLARPLNGLLHAWLVQHPVRRAVFHFINQTLLRVQRYRIYLVLYGGVGLSVVAATILRVTIAQQQVRLEVSPDGIRAAIGIVAFWTIAGLRIAFVSSGNQQGSWIFRVIHGRPPHFRSAVQQSLATKEWVMLWGMMLTFAACFVLRAVAPPELRTWPATASQFLIAAGMCLLLTDIFFLHVMIIPFTGEPAREQTSLAITLLKYFAFIPVVTWLSASAEPWVELSSLHFLLAATVIAAAHRVLQWRHRAITKEHCNLVELEDGEEEFPMKLGLRY